MVPNESIFFEFIETIMQHKDILQCVKGKETRFLKEWVSLVNCCLHFFFLLLDMFGFSLGIFFQPA